jgi:hypothetical protein
MEMETEDELVCPLGKVLVSESEQRLGREMVQKMGFLLGSTWWAEELECWMGASREVQLALLWGALKGTERVLWWVLGLATLTATPWARKKVGQLGVRLALPMVQPKETTLALGLDLVLAKKLAPMLWETKLGLTLVYGLEEVWVVRLEEVKEGR